MRRLLALLPVLAAAPILAACGPTPTVTPAATAAAPTTAPSAGPTPGPTTAPTAGPTSAGIDATELIPGQALTAGRYTRSAFEPRVTFEVGEGWRAVQVGSGFFDIQQDSGSPDVIAVQFARPTGFYGADGALIEPATAQAAADAIEANPALTILESSPSKLGGLDGFVVEVENPATASGPASVLDVPPGALSIDPARRLWVAVFDTPDGIVAVLVGGSVAKWDAALAAAEPVLESVTIGE